MEDRPRLLIIENEAATRERLTWVLANPPSGWLQDTGITGFRVDVAATSEEACLYLKRARRENREPEIVLLDLRLPATQEELEAQDEVTRNGRDEHGRKMLQTICDSCDAAVVILTGFPTEENLVYALRHGATDFLVKPIADREREAMLFVRLVNAIGKSRRDAHRDLRAERLLKLKDHDGKSDRESFARLASEKIGQISDGLSQLAETLSRRYGLDPRHDAEDVMYKQLAAIQRTANDLVEMAWKPSEDEKPVRFEKAVDVAAIMAEQIARARPCYLYRGVHLNWASPCEGRLLTDTFPDDLRLMICELVLGSLEPSPEEEIVELRSESSQDGKDIMLSAARRGEPVPRDIQSSLRQGDWAEKGIEGKWQGLCFLQRIANNIGTHLDIQSSREKTIVTLQIPVTGND